MSPGETAIAATNTYTIGSTALVITLPTYTQDFACGYTETKSCFLTASPTACPSWVTATSTTWTIYCSAPATCPAGVYSLIFKTALNNSPVSSDTQTQSITIVDPCTLANGNSIATDTVDDMTTSALSTTAVTQTLTARTDSASFTAGIASMCGASTFTLVAGTYDASYLSISGNTLTLLGTSLSDIGTHTGVQVEQCLAAYNDVCRTFTFTVDIGPCIITAFNAPTFAAQSYTILDAYKTISMPTYTQVPACQYSVSYTSKIQKTADANVNRLSLFPD